MKAVIYLPNKEPNIVSAEGMYLPDSKTGLVPNSDRAATILGCPPQLVDVLDSGPDFVAFSIFDSQAAVNEPAILALDKLSRHTYGVDEDDALLKGPVLILSKL